jgi:predicted outer membrane repeat protein
MKMALSMMCALVCAAGAAAGATWDVYPGGSIQRAIDQAQSGDTVLVHPGTYVETLDYAGKGITVTGTAPDDSLVVLGTRVNANGQGSVVRFISGEDGDAVLRGLALTGGNGLIYRLGSHGGESRAGGGVFCSNGSSPTISNCMIFNNHVIEGATAGGGIYCEGGSSPLIDSCVIRNNELFNYAWDGLGGGISAFDSAPTITDCTITENQVLGSYAAGGGIYCSNSDAVIERCRITLNVADDNGDSGQGGGICYLRSSPTVTDCTITGNRAIGFTASGGGVAGILDSSPHFLRCLIADNAAVGAIAAGGGARLGSAAILERCTISKNWCSAEWGGGGIDVYYSATPLLTSSIVWDNSPSAIADNGPGIEVEYSDVQGGWAGLANIDADPLFCDVRCGLDDLGLASSSPCLGTGKNGVDIGSEGESCSEPMVAGEVIVVPGDYASVGDAVASACDGDTILISPGTYGESEIDLEGKPIVVTSLDPENPDVVAATIIDGQGSGPIFLFQSDEDTSSQLSGVTIQNGQAIKGGGLYFNDNVAPLISHCVLRNNHATAEGGGAYCRDAPVEFRACRFENNSADGTGGGVSVQAGDPILIDCEFVGNTAPSGGGYYNTGGDEKLLRCRFTGNSATGGGGAVYTGAYTNMVACTFSDNSAATGGGVYLSSARFPVATRNCVFKGNSATSNGAAIYGASSQLTLEQFTVVKNTGSVAVYCLNYAQERTVATNCIFWNEGVGELYISNSQADITYCDVQGGWSGEGNIDLDPRYRDKGGYVAILWPGSPCIDTGTGDPDGVDWSTIHPVYGQYNRPAPDMGAYGGPLDTDWLP